MYDTSQNTHGRPRYLTSPCVHAHGRSKPEPAPRDYDNLRAGQHQRGTTSTTSATLGRGALRRLEAAIPTRGPRTGRGSADSFPGSASATVRGGAARCRGRCSRHCGRFRRSRSAMRIAATSAADQLSIDDRPSRRSDPAGGAGGPVQPATGPLPEEMTVHPRQLARPFDPGWGHEQGIYSSIRLAAQKFLAARHRRSRRRRRQAVALTQTGPGASPDATRSSSPASAWAASCILAAIAPLTTRRSARSHRAGVPALGTACAVRPGGRWTPAGRRVQRFHARVRARHAGPMTPP